MIFTTHSSRKSERVRGTGFAEKPNWSCRIPLFAGFYKHSRPPATVQPCGLRSFDWVVSCHPIKNHSNLHSLWLSGEDNQFCAPLNDVPSIVFLPQNTVFSSLKYMVCLIYFVPLFKRK